MIISTKKIVYAAAWGVGFYMASSVVIGYCAGLWFGYQISQGNTIPANIPGHDVIIILAAPITAIIGLIGLILGLLGLLPGTHIQQSAK